MFSICEFCKYCFECQRSPFNPHPVATDVCPVSVFKDDTNRICDCSLYVNADI